MQRWQKWWKLWWSLRFSCILFSSGSSIFPWTTSDFLSCTTKYTWLIQFLESVHFEISYHNINTMRLLLFLSIPCSLFSPPSPSLCVLCVFNALDQLSGTVINTLIGIRGFNLALGRHGGVVHQWTMNEPLETH